MMIAIAKASADDEAALLAFRARVSHAAGSPPTLASWNDSAHFYSWEGVACSHRRRPARRVVALRWNGTVLTGPLSQALGNVTFLQTLDLTFNRLSWEIPASLGCLHRLRRLYWNDNAFSGMFPANLSSYASMTEMGLENNKLGGRIPAELGEKLMSLGVISLSTNSFTWPIPTSLANLSYLQFLDLSSNQLSGSIPPGLGSIQSIRQFSVDENFLTGMLPPSPYNWSSLEVFAVGYNMLYGSIMDDISDKFPKMKALSFFSNHFAELLPSSLSNIPRKKKSLSNMSVLIVLLLGKNRFSGYVPSTLGRLGALQILHVGNNRLEANN